MTLDEVCSLFDRFEVLDMQLDIEMEYYAACGVVYSDGEIESNINREGYIHITKVSDASYIIFIDRNNNTFLCIYKYIAETKFKDIIDYAGKLKELRDKLTPSEPQEDTEPINIFPNDELIDINEFKCTECGFEDKMKFVRMKNDSDTIMCKCKHCCAEYTFIPSKYYRLASKRIIYKKSDNSSRNINIALEEVKKQNGKR